MLIRKTPLSRYGKVYCHTGRVVHFLLFSFHLFLIDFSVCHSEVFCLPICGECLPGDLSGLWRHIHTYINDLLTEL